MEHIVKFALVRILPTDEQPSGAVLVEITFSNDQVFTIMDTDGEPIPERARECVIDLVSALCEEIDFEDDLED